MPPENELETVHHHSVSQRGLEDPPDHVETPLNIFVAQPSRAVHPAHELHPSHEEAEMYVAGIAPPSAAANVSSVAHDLSYPPFLVM